MHKYSCHSLLTYLLFFSRLHSNSKLSELVLRALSLNSSKVAHLQIRGAVAAVLSSGRGLAPVIAPFSHYQPERQHISGSWRFDSPSSSTVLSSPSKFRQGSAVRRLSYHAQRLPVGPAPRPRRRVLRGSLRRPDARRVLVGGGLLLDIEIALDSDGRDFGLLRLTTLGGLAFRATTKMLRAARAPRRRITLHTREQILIGPSQA